MSEKSLVLQDEDVDGVSAPIHVTLQKQKHRPDEKK